MEGKQNRYCEAKKKKSVSILTIHDIGNNYGSTLQSCSLYEYVESLGYEVKLIDYKPNDRTNLQNLKHMLKSIYFSKNIIKRNKRFEEYFSSHSNRTITYKSYNELCQNPPLSDIYLLGSDQVWNPTLPRGNDPAYYLEFTDSNKKMAFSASLGRIQDNENLKKIAERIKKFKFISVREKKSVNQLESVGYNDVVNTVDPVFLNPKEYYLKSCNKNGMGSKYGRYLLVYTVNENSVLDEYIKKVSSDYGLKVIAVGGLKKKCECDIFLRDIGPIEFVELINNSFYFLTSSFHGAALSIILQKQFSVVLPKINSLRIENILDICNINNVILNKYCDTDIVKENTIDFKKVQLLLDTEIEKSKLYLKESLTQL